MSNFNSGPERTNTGVPETPNTTQNGSSMSTARTVGLGGTIYTFPDVTLGAAGSTRSPNQPRGHLRSVSHGGSSNLVGGSSSAGVVGRSALKGMYIILMKVYKMILIGVVCSVQKW